MTTYTQTASLVPAINSAGKFVANSPFNVIVNDDVYYTVEATRTISEMLADGEDLYSLMLEPAGVNSRTDADAILTKAKELGALVIVLTSRGNPPVYVLTTFLKSFPLTDGVIYEHLCLIVNLGSVPPTLKDTIESVKEHISSYVTATVGVANTVLVGSVPTKSYVSKDQADVFETTRKKTITDSNSDAVKLAKLEEELNQKNLYIQELERKIQQG